MTRLATAVRAIEMPLGEMNTTPLIDVMLALLVMLILAVPPSVNQLPVDLPSRDYPDRPIINHDKNLVSIDRNSVIGWNGQQVTPEQLSALLAATQRLDPEPELQFEPAAAAPYDTAAKVLNTIKRSGVSAFGFVGNDRYAAFGRAAPGR